MQGATLFGASLQGGEMTSIPGNRGGKWSSVMHGKNTAAEDDQSILIEMNETNGFFFKTTPPHLEIIITWCYRRPFHIVFPPFKVSNAKIPWMYNRLPSYESLPITTTTGISYCVPFVLSGNGMTAVYRLN